MDASQKTVMIVEDEPDAAEMFAEMMRVNGYRVVKMFSSGPAISMIAREKPDVIILDVMMPDISGLEVLRYMRREPNLKAIPVIIVSAKGMPSDIKSGLDAGATKYLTKPVGFRDLVRAVEQAIPNKENDDRTPRLYRHRIFGRCACRDPGSDRPFRRSLGDDIVRWIPVSNLHLTLKFLGETAATHVEFIKQLLVDELRRYDEFDLQIGGLGAFPTPKRPRVLWLGLQAPAALASIQRTIESGATRLGYEKDERPFSPHLTIGRIRPNTSLDEMQKIRAGLESQQLGKIATCRVDSVQLFKSDLKPNGPIYTRLFSAKLKSAPAARGVVFQRGDS